MTDVEILETLRCFLCEGLMLTPLQDQDCVAYLEREIDRLSGAAETPRFHEFELEPAEPFPGVNKSAPTPPIGTNTNHPD